MELFFTSDLHGSSGHYEQVLEQVRRRQCDVVVLGGDMLPDGDRGRPYRAVCRYIQQKITVFLEQLHEINGDIDILTIFGNHDWSFSVDEFAELQQRGLLTMLEYNRVVEIGGLKFLGLSYSPPAPYWIKDFERRDRTNDNGEEFGGYVWSAEKGRIMPIVAHEYFAGHDSLEKMFAEAPGVDDSFVLVTHAPPARSNLDVLEGGLHVGSWSVRHYIESVHPMLSLHGHVHESPVETGHFSDNIGGCLCVNPGQEHHKLCAVWWNSDQPDRVDHTIYP